MRLDVRHAFGPKQNSTRTAEVMDHFGIGFEAGEHVIAEGFELPLQCGDVVLFTGESGSGKSSLMRAAVQALRLADTRQKGESPKPERPVVVDINELELGVRPLIDSIELPVKEAMHLLSACGLGEAHLMLRTPSELSDGQRYRFRFALGLAAQPTWLVADEFTATLDRKLAKVVAFNVRRIADRTGTGFLLATTHEDVAADLSPDVHVQCRLDGDTRVERRSAADEPGTADAINAEGRKKKERSPFRMRCGSAERPSATGRTSLGGITGAITWG